MPFIQSIHRNREEINSGILALFILGAFIYYEYIYKAATLDTTPSDNAYQNLVDAEGQQAADATLEVQTQGANSNYNATNENIDNLFYACMVFAGLFLFKRLGCHGVSYMANRDERRLVLPTTSVNIQHNDTSSAVSFNTFDNRSETYSARSDSEERGLLDGTNSEVSTRSSVNYNPETYSGKKHQPPTKPVRQPPNLLDPDEEKFNPRSSDESIFPQQHRSETSFLTTNKKKDGKTSAVLPNLSKTLRKQESASTFGKPNIVEEVLREHLQGYKPVSATDTHDDASSQSSRHSSFSVDSKENNNNNQKKADAPKPFIQDADLESRHGSDSSLPNIASAPINDKMKPDFRDPGFNLDYGVGKGKSKSMSFSIPRNTYK